MYTIKNCKLFHLPSPKQVSKSVKEYVYVHCISIHAL